METSGLDERLERLERLNQDGLGIVHPAPLASTPAPSCLAPHGKSWGGGGGGGGGKATTLYRSPSAFVVSACMGKIGNNPHRV